MLDFLEDNLKKVLKSIDELCYKYSIKREYIALCAVSKTKPLEYIQKINDCGVDVFGENYVQEICSKFPIGEKKYSLHMIGHLQSNKVSKVIPYVDSIDSVDSLSLLEKINSCADKLSKVVDVLLECNTSLDSNKTGFTNFDELSKCLDAFENMHNVNFKGMMTMGPLGGNESDIEKSFDKFNQIFDKAKSRYKNLDFSIKSFGMSSDYKIALKMGSNFLRIGTAIFGERDYGRH